MELGQEIWIKAGYNAEYKLSPSGAAEGDYVRSTWSSYFNYKKLGIVTDTASPDLDDDDPTMWLEYRSSEDGSLRYIIYEPSIYEFYDTEVVTTNSRGQVYTGGILTDPQVRYDDMNDLPVGTTGKKISFWKRYLWQVIVAGIGIGVAIYLMLKNSVEKKKEDAKYILSNFVK